MTEYEFKKLLKKVNKRPKEWREGQAWFNYLLEIRPDLAKRIRGSNYDPFHNDELIPKFIEFITSRNI